MQTIMLFLDVDEHDSINVFSKALMYFLLSREFFPHITTQTVLIT